MEKKMQHIERRGLPGGPNEYITHISEFISADVNNPYNIIQSGNITMKNIKVEVEGNELALKNSYGDVVIIPVNKANWVKQKLSEGCHGCIDSLVESLPSMKDYAEDGTVIPEEPIYDGGVLKEVIVTAEAPQWLKYKREYENKNPYDNQEYVQKRFDNPIGREAIAKIDQKGWMKKLNQEGLQKRENASLDYASQQIIKNKPQGKLSRAEWLNTLSNKEEELVKRNAKNTPTLWNETARGLTSLTENNSFNTINNILTSKQFSQREKREMLKDHMENPIMSKFTDAFKVLTPLTVPSKMVQSAYKKDYSFKDALKGKQNNAGIVEDIITDPLNLIGLGLWSKLSKANKFAKIEDAYQAVKGLSKEEGLSKLNQMGDNNVGNIFKNPLTDKDKEMYKWFNEQLKFDKLPETKNKQSLGVLEDFKQRIKTPEGQKRMKELRIDNDEMLQNLKIIEDDKTFGYYSGNKNKIVLNPLDPLNTTTVRHEIEHGVQNTISRNAIKKEGKLIPIIKRIFTDPMLKNPSKKSQGISEIDDILSGLELRREATPNKVWKGHVVNDAPVNMSEYKSLISNKQNATDYFLTGSEGREKSAFLGEVQQYMLDNGHLKNAYDKVTPEMVKNTMVDAMFDEEKGGKFLRLFNIMKANDKNYDLISKGLNKMLGIVPPAIIGTQALKNNKDK